MPLPKRKLPSLDNDFNSVNTHEEFEEIQELTDDDFLNDSSDFEQVEPSESSSYVQDEIEEAPEPEEIEEVKSKPKKEKKGRIKPKKKKFDYKKLTKKHYFIISGVFVTFLIAFVAISLLMKPKDNTDNNTEATTQVVQTENKTDVKYKFKKETSNGIIFEVTSEHSAKINLQRAFYDAKGNIVVCESGDIEIIKGSQDVFAECVNNKEGTDIKDTEKNLIKDNLIEIKE